MEANHLDVEETREMLSAIGPSMQQIIQPRAARGNAPATGSMAAINNQIATSNSDWNRISNRMSGLVAPGSSAAIGNQIA